MANVNILNENWQPTTPLVDSEVGTFHIQKSQEFLEREADLGRSLGVSALSAVRIDELIDDRTDTSA